MRRFFTLSFALCLAFCPSSPALASKPRIHLQGLDSSALSKDELRLYASALELEGTPVDDLSAEQFTLLVDGKAVGRAIRAQRFGELSEELDVVFVIEIGAQYKRDLETIKTALTQLLDDAPPRLRAMLIPFSSDFDTDHGFQPPGAAASLVDDLAVDEDSSELRMVDAVGAALTELKKRDSKDANHATPQRAIVLISDGLNGRMDRATIRALGSRAAQAGIPIHAIAFSPTDERGPLLNLGELSKRSNGSFRWAMHAGDLAAQFQNLSDELKKEYVLTFKLPDSLTATSANHSYALREGELVSNALGAAALATPPGSNSFMRRFSNPASTVYAVLAGLLLLLGAGLALFLRRRAPRTPLVRMPLPTKLPAVPAARLVATEAPRVAKVQTAAAGGKPGHAANQSRAVTLIGIEGCYVGKRVSIVGGLMSLGKAPGQGLTITDDPTVSGRHAEFGSDAQSPFVRDLGSTNGTFVNNQRITGLARLSDGDIVRFGGATQFKIRID